MKLYELPANSGIKIFEKCTDGSEYVEFHHLDGAYSYCVTEHGGVVHLLAGTPLVKTEQGYEIVKENI